MSKRLDAPAGAPQPRWPSRKQRRERFARSFVGRCLQRSDDLQLGTTALALGAQEVLCTAPLLVALSSLTGAFHIGYVGGFLDDLLGLDASSAASVRELFRASRTPDVGSLWLGLGAAILFYVAVASMTQRAVDAIWDVEAPLWTGWWRRVAWVAVQLPVFTGALVLGGYLRRWGVSPTATNIAYALLLGASAGLFHWWGHHLLLAAHVSWRGLAPGSAFIGLGVMALVLLSPFVMPGQITENVQDYGLVGAAFILSLWAVTYSAIVVYGTLIGRVLNEARPSH